MDDQIIFKIIVLGQQGVGKSAMLLRYMKGQFSSQYTVTIGVEFASKNIPVDNNKQVKLQIWDTAGQQAFKAIVRSFYKGIAAVFLTFALNSEESLEGLKAWQKEVRENGHQEIIFILVGTKSDMGKPQLAEKAQRMLRQLEGAFFIQTSAKTNQNIEQVKIIGYSFSKWQQKQCIKSMSLMKNIGVQQILQMIDQDNEHIAQHNTAKKVKNKKRKANVVNDVHNLFCFCKQVYQKVWIKNFLSHLPFL